MVSPPPRIVGRVGELRFVSWTCFRCRSFSFLSFDKPAAEIPPLGSDLDSRRPTARSSFFLLGFFGIPARRYRLQQILVVSPSTVEREARNFITPPCSPGKGFFFLGDMSPSRLGDAYPVTPPSFAPAQTLSSEKSFLPAFQSRD